MGGLVGARFRLSGSVTLVRIFYYLYHRHFPSFFDFKAMYCKFAVIHIMNIEYTMTDIAIHITHTW